MTSSCSTHKQWPLVKTIPLDQAYNEGWHFSTFRKVQRLLPRSSPPSCYEFHIRRHWGWLQGSQTLSEVLPEMSLLFQIYSKTRHSLCWVESSSIWKLKNKMLLVLAFQRGSEIWASGATYFSSFQLFLIKKTPQNKKINHHKTEWLFRLQQSLITPLQNQNWKGRFLMLHMKLWHLPAHIKK